MILLRCSGSKTDRLHRPPRASLTAWTTYMKFGACWNSKESTRRTQESCRELKCLRLCSVSIDLCFFLWSLMQISGPSSFFSSWLVILPPLQLTKVQLDKALQASEKAGYHVHETPPLPRFRRPCADAIASTLKSGALVCHALMKKELTPRLQAEG